ncbi:hypothetical protein LZ30DRAFT_127576 [Colletotrichum cereale]|nr:hypothetical protein LZ30DRAFT_127576 [Colletotrichum cereale]
MDRPYPRVGSQPASASLVTNSAAEVHPLCHGTWPLLLARYCPGCPHEHGTHTVPDTPAPNRSTLRHLTAVNCPSFPLGYGGLWSKGSGGGGSRGGVYAHYEKPEAVDTGQFRCTGLSRSNHTLRTRANLGRVTTSERLPLPLTLQGQRRITCFVKDVE